MRQILVILLIMVFVGEGVAQSNRSKRPKPPRHKMVELFKQARGNSRQLQALIDSLRTHSMKQNVTYAEESAAPDTRVAPDALTFILAQNYPNPFNPTTTIWYQLPVISRVTLKVYNVLGQEVATLVDEDQGAGNHHAVWNATRFASGLYVYHLKIRDESGKSLGIRRTMILLK